MSSEFLEVRCAAPPSAEGHATAFLPLILASAVSFVSFWLRTRSFGPALLVAGAGLLLGSAIYAYSRWVWTSSFLRWDGSELVAHEGFSRWRLKPQKGLTAITARVRVGGQRSSFYLWVVDETSRPLLRIKVKLWPQNELRALLERIGCAPPDLREPTEPTTARRLRQQNRRLLPFWMAHQIASSVAVSVLMVAALVAIF